MIIILIIILVVCVVIFAPKGGDGPKPDLH